MVNHVTTVHKPAATNIHRSMLTGNPLIYSVLKLFTGLIIAALIAW